ncbi:MAG: acyl-CoA thioesterase [Syntrophobacterales bacterium]|jgi:acyl-CoA thioester hydrolase|nr:acyl-CoA thioesterase [Syntrophobacterales bacterium]
MPRSDSSSADCNIPSVDVPIRVRYADTDKMGVVYYGNYPVYFETGRSEYMREKGFTYKEFEGLGYYLMVVNLEAKYYNNATYDDLIIVKTSMPELRSRGLTFHYSVYKDETLLVQGSTKHLCVNNERKAVAIPSHLYAILKDANTR